HVVRFLEDTDIYIYRETIDKEFIRAGHLVNRNGKYYPFVPIYTIQTSDNGIVIAGQYSVDTIINRERYYLDYGSWPIIMKLSAETLGIPVSTSDSPHEAIRVSLMPNPATDRLVVLTSSELKNGTVRIIDQAGRTVLSQDINAELEELDIAGLSVGMYFVSLSQNGQVIHTQKFIKQ
ncbi:MAG: T9SS type A sorting domain-containing protein, partial [Chitinophagales bacterium]|nr:T9SS type A sorting domain-containing protein [Chitinophagales bacterium]